MAAEEDLVQLASGDSSVTIHLHGATVISWKFHGEEVLFCSKKSLFDNKKAIRGGIPLVFPNFGPWDLGPQHGFARIKRWTLVSWPDKDDDGHVSAAFCLEDDDETRKMWNHRFKLLYRVCLEKSSLFLSLEVTNTGTDKFDFTTLMHTYFQVPDITNVRILGLEGTNYIDKVHGGEHKEDRSLIQVDENYDRIYKNVPGIVQIQTQPEEDSSAVTVAPTNLPDIVVWNPWAEKAKAMSDFDDEEYKTMVCVEAGAVENRVMLEPDDFLIFTQRIAKSRL